MNGTLTGILVLLVIVLVIAIAYVVAKDRAAGHEPGQLDAVSDEVTSGLMAELRKWQAEAEHWKRTAERLQRELDERQ
jgi:hypothetical protein